MIEPKSLNLTRIIMALSQHFKKTSKLRQIQKRGKAYLAQIVGLLHNYKEERWIKSQVKAH